jgi:hypothetical protein
MRKPERRRKSAGIPGIVYPDGWKRVVFTVEHITCRWQSILPEPV